MAWAPDLSYYSYNLNRPLKNVFNVGWLDARHDFDRGRVDPITIVKIRHIINRRECRLTRRACRCGFCAQESEQTPSNLTDARLAGSDTAPHSHGEIWVPAHGGYVFAAPSLIAHFIENHGYRPPEQFLDAVEAFDIDTVFDGDALFRQLTQLESA
ncbi:MAG: hypothetical protein RLY93_18700 [Sumerlaeia bacterium]